MILPGSYANGFAPRDGEPLYPSLWHGCVGAWAPCLGPTGATLRDWSGFKNHCTITNATLGTLWTPRAGKHAITTDGVNDLVEATVPQISGSTGITLSGWVWRSSGNWGFGFGGVVNTARMNFLMFSNVLYASVPGASTAYSEIATSAVGMNHYTMQFTASSFARIWINGIEQNVTVTGAGGASATGSGMTTFWIGREIANGYQIGSYVDVMVHNRRLSSSEIKLLATRPGIAYEPAPRRRASVAVAASFNRRRRLLVGAGS
jgi:hypothetical protein